MKRTHENYIDAIRKVAAARLNEEAARRKILQAKLVYGSGQPGVRGTCFYESWENDATLEFVEICAFGEESAIQLAGTTLHELAHCLAGWAAGHGAAWKSAAKTLGLTRAVAAGQRYSVDDFAPALWAVIESLPRPADGQPRVGSAVRSPRACPLGHGTRGGASRGPGSGSRLRLFVCACTPPVRIRVARDPANLRVRCLDCGVLFRSPLAAVLNGPDLRGDARLQVAVHDLRG